MQPINTTSDPTGVLVHGAFADASGFAGLIRELSQAGYDVLAPPNPLRGIEPDAAAVRAVATDVEVSVLLIGHSYGGAVITQAAADLENVVGMVYLARFAPAAGESCASVQAPFLPPLLAGVLILALGAPQMF